MPRLIKQGALTENPWHRVAKDCDVAELHTLDASHLLLPFTLWQSEAESLTTQGKTLAVWLDSDEDPELLVYYLQSLHMVALNFPTFMDGRAYTSATSLRQRYGFTGEIRAVGDVLRDQLFFLKRCGFDAFELHDSVDTDDALSAFADFSTSYMSTVEEPEPLFRRRL